MLRAIEAADAKDQNTGARDVLKMRLKLQDDIIQLRVNAATGVRKLAIGAEGTEMTKVEVTYESARARSELLKRDLQADLQLAKREVAAARRKSKSGTAAKRRAEVEEPPAPTPSPKRPRREAPAPTSTSASARNGTSARSASASTSRAARAHSVTVPQGELPAPPAGFADWHDFYMSDEGLIDLAQAEARIQASMDPRQDRKRFRASFGNVLVTKPPCGICIKYDLPCLYIDPVQNPFAADKPPRCIICQEWKFHCNPRPGDTKTSPAPHVHAGECYRSSFHVLRLSILLPYYLYSVIPTYYLLMQSPPRKY
ncbi:hypothetical protein C8F01DRAFT_269701 [Mycena amicta]|nr:hypothetical protein C8F01DRAFT_269701 [Mycena amicta]